MDLIRQMIPLQDQMRIAKVKGAYNSLIIGPRGLKCETNLYEIIGWESSDVVRFDLGLLPQGQTRTAKVKGAYNSLIFGPRGWQCETKLLDIMAWEPSDVFRFDLGPLLQGQTRIKNLNVLINHLLLVLELGNVKPIYRKS